MLSSSCVQAQWGKRNKGKSSEAEPYYENLSTVRPKYETGAEDSASTVKAVPEDPTHHDNEKVEQRVAYFKKLNSNYTTTNGFRVQVYSGTSINDAEKQKMKARELLKKYFEEEEITVVPVPHTYMPYDAPMFRVRIGDYIHKVRAYRILQVLKEEFPNALIVPDQVLLRRID